ncbi:MAG: heme peroxidase, partial [Hyphomicrobiales bacterium]|nr:heme peroxidase [Hyphomicrobiales bacterium]
TGVTHLNGDVMGFADSNIELARTADTSRPLLAVRGEQILDIEGHSGPANMGDLKYDATHNVITQSYKTAHAYGDILVAHPGMGIYSGSGNGTAGNGTILAKSNTDLGFVNQQYIADFRPDMGENPDGTPASGYNSHEVIAGTDFNDWIDAGNGDDTVYGDKGNDVLDGKAGADHLYGGDGQDVLYGGDIEDFLDGGRGDDIIYAGTSAGALDVVIGGAGNDKLYGEAGIDEIYGGAGDDYIDAGGDTDLAFGDAGNDIMFGGDGPDELRGGLGDDILSGGSAADMLLGEGGDDIFFGGLGQAAQTGDSDEDLGGDGFDIAAYSDVTIVLDVPADLRNLGVVGAVGGTAANPFNQLLTEIEGVIGSKFNDRIIGADAGTGADGQPTGDNWLIGGGGADTFNTTVANAAGSIGQGGNDVIVGDTIRLDTLIGSYGANSYLNGTDALGNATHDIDGTLGQGLLGNATLGTTMFAKHFTDLIKTERNKDMVLGQDGGGAGDDTVIYSGNRADYSVTVIDFDTAPANPSPHITIKAYKIVDLRSGSPDGTDLVVGVESFQFADRTLNETQMQNHAPTGTLSFSPGESGSNAVLTPISALFDQENISLPGNPLGTVTPSYNWQTSTNGVTWLTIPSGNGSGQQSVGTNILRQAQTAGKLVRLVASYTDAALNPESVAQTWNLVVGTSANNNLLIGTASLVIGDVIFGLGGNDTISGLAGDDQLYGGAGNDALDGGTGADVMAGGSGNDIYVVENADDVVTEAAGAGTDTINTSLSSYTLLANFENLLYSGTSTFAGTGNAAVNSITGGAGNDTLNGAGGNDTLLGLGGDDTYTVDNAGVTIVEAAGGGTDTVRTSLASYTLAANLENLTYTGLGNFIGNGNALDNVIVGGAGNDTLDGKAGADTLIGLGGNDLYFVDNPGDVVQEAVNDGTDRVSTALGSLTLGDNVENLTHTGSTPFIGNGNILDNVITGGTGSDTLNGLGGNDTLSGSSGNDTLDGGTGADVMAGGTGDDAYYVDDLADSVVENANSGTDIVSTSLSTLTLVANIENLVYTGPSNFAGTGNASANAILGAAGNDTLLGLAGGDTLIGGVGSDTLNGGAGSDVLNGGSGVDYFVFDTALGTGSTQSGVDTIDFVHGQDFIYLDNAIFTSLGASGGLQASFFVSNMTGSAGDTDDYVIYNSLNGWLTYDSNGSVLSGGINNHFATLQTGLALSSSDFLVI